MNNSKTLVMAAAFAMFATLASAQDTNLLTTKLAVFEARTGVVVVKAIGQIGTLPLGSVELTVRCKETTDANTGEKIYGLAFGLDAGQSPREWIFVDDDEVDSLMGGVGYLSKTSFDVTTLPSFEATYTTRAGLRLIADSVRKDGGVLTYLQFGDYPRIPISPVQMTQLYNLVQQGRKNLDALKAGK